MRGAGHFLTLHSFGVAELAGAGILVGTDFVEIGLAVLDCFIHATQGAVFGDGLDLCPLAAIHLAIDLIPFGLAVPCPGQLDAGTCFSRLFQGHASEPHGADPF